MQTTLDNHLELQRRTAYLKDTPIVSPDKMPKALDNALFTRNVHNDTEWMQALRDNQKWWLSENMKTNQENLHHQKLYALHKILLSFGGAETCLDLLEEDINKILNYGQFWYGDKAKLMKGEPSQCHANSCELWELNHKDFDVHIATGYALTSDAMWRQHTWLVWKKPRSFKIIETTVKRLAYFGFVMTEEEAYEFCDQNY